MTKEKQTIIGYPISDIAAIIICFFFVAVAVSLYDRTSIIFFATILLFGLGGISLVFNTFYKKRYVSRNSNEAQEIRKRKSLELINGLGVFEYDNYGFSIIIYNKEEYIAWDEIQKLVAFKIDLLTYDEIRLQIHLENGAVFEFGEEIPGWFQFLVRSKEQFPSINPLWEVDISSPAFEKKETVIYNGFILDVNLSYNTSNVSIHS